MELYMNKLKYIRWGVLSLLLMFGLLFGQKPYRVGTTAASFLEYGYGPAGSAMGDAYVAMANDLSSMYWNPAGLAFMKQSEAQFLVQPWVVDINTSYATAGMVLPGIGTIGLGFMSVDYGDMEVTTVDMQEGTGEQFQAKDYAINLSYARALTDWFAFGANAKYIGSEIWHTSASALALDLGVIVKTAFFSPTSERAQGLRIGMSISNYGTRMRYNGIDLVQSIDIDPYADGNYQYTQGQFRLSEWELPLLFRIGVSVIPVYTEKSRLRLAVDALHPNNSSEYVNIGAEYEYNLTGTGKVFLRAGYKSLFLPESEYGLGVGAGFVKYLMNNLALKVDYAYRDVGVLGKVHSYSLGFMF